MASSIVIPSRASVGAGSDAANTALVAERNSYDGALANAVVAGLTAASSDITALQSGSSIALATSSTQGAMSAADKAKLDLIEGALTKRSVRILYSTALSGLGAGVKTYTAPMVDGSDTTLPANARYVGHVVGEGSFIGFSNGAAATYTLKVGSPSDDDCIVSSVDVATGQTGFPKTGTAGVRAFSRAPLYAEVFSVILTSDADLNTATAGVITVSLFFQVKT